MAELVDALVSGTSTAQVWRFESSFGHLAKDPRKFDARVFSCSISSGAITFGESRIHSGTGENFAEPPKARADVFRGLPKVSALSPPPKYYLSLSLTTFLSGIHTLEYRGGAPSITSPKSAYTISYNGSEYTHPHKSRKRNG